MDALRNEQVEDIKSLAAFNKLKIILVVGVLAVGYGGLKLSGAGNDRYEALKGSELSVLSLIPMICAYIDMMYCHYLGKIFVRGEYFRCIKDSPSNDASTKANRDYELFVQDIRKNVDGIYSFESTAQFATSLFISALSLVGMFFAWVAFDFSLKFYAVSVTIGVSFLLGTCISLITWWKHHNAVATMRQYAHSKRTTTCSE